MAEAEEVLGEGALALDAAAALLGSNRLESPVAEHVHDLDGRHEAVSVAHPVPRGGGEDGGGGAVKLLVGEGGEVLVLIATIGSVSCEGIP